MDLIMSAKNARDEATNAINRFKRVIGDKIYEASILGSYSVTVHIPYAQDSILKHLKNSKYSVNKTFEDSYCINWEEIEDDYKTDDELCTCACGGSGCFKCCLGYAEPK